MNCLLPSIKILQQMTHTSLPRGPFPLPGRAVGAEGEAAGGAVTNGTNSVRIASCRDSPQ